MPYTPPSRGSPATSNAASPVLTRNHSYEKASSRPDLPRSRSAIYIQRHRRTPSLADRHHELPHSPLSVDSNTAHNSSFPRNGLLGRGFTTSPITSYSPEDDEDRGRQKQLKDLADTLRESMVMPKRPHSPTRAEEGPTPVAPKSTPAAATSVGTSSPALTPEALKIAHSRSSSEVQLSSQSNHLDVPDYSPGDSAGDSDDDALEMRRAPLLRKKSGELVKPALRNLRRPSSAPGTPTYHKAVHFNEEMEQVRHFLQVDRPIAVSAGSSPVEIYDSESDYPFGDNESAKPRGVEWEIQTANFPKNIEERQFMPVRVEEIHLSKDSKSLIGVVSVANIAFEKFVVARFTFDYWKTTSEVVAEFNNGPDQKKNPDGYDRFQFSIRLSDQANLQNKTLYLCVRYNSGGQEHWDSNSNKNFQVDFIRKTAAKAPVRPAQTAAGSIPRSRGSDRTSPMIRPRSFPSSSADDEFSTGFDSPFKMRKSAELPARVNPSKEAPAPTAQHHHGARLANRYDFGASLQAALTNAQMALGERSGLRIVAPKTVKRTVVAPAPAPAVQPVDNLARPELNSREYNDLIQKFCYFGSGGNNSGVVSPEVVEKAQPKAMDFQQMDGAVDSGSESNASSAGSSASNSPPSPKAKLHQVEPLQESKALNRTPSPSLRALSPRLLPYRSPSPATSAYQEFPHQGLSVQTTQC